MASAGRETFDVELHRGLLAIAFPEFRFGYQPGHGCARWVAVRKDIRAPGVHTVVTDDLDELVTVLVREVAWVCVASLLSWFPAPLPSASRLSSGCARARRVRGCSSRGSGLNAWWWSYAPAVRDLPTRSHDAGGLPPGVKHSPAAGRMVAAAQEDTHQDQARTMALEEHPAHSVNPPRCPAQQAHGIDIASACFELVAEDCADEDGTGDLTEITGYFRQRGGEFDDDEHLNDALVTAVLQVPEVSMMAFIAHQVTSGSSRAMMSKVEKELRANIALCPCTAAGECPALNETSMTRALERAID